MSSTIYSFVNENFDMCRFEMENSIFKYFENDVEKISGHVSMAKNFFVPLAPKYIDGTLILFDYDYGVELINANKNVLLPMSTIWDAHVIGSTLIAVSYKKIFFINILSGDIINDVNFSPNCEVAKDKNVALFYRIKRNKSFLYFFDTKELVELKNFPQNDGSLIRIVCTNNLIYAFTFYKIYVYDLKQQKVIIENNLQYNGMGARYSDCIEILINDEIVNMNNLENEFDLAKALYHNYGAFITMSYTDRDLIRSRQEKYLDILYQMRNLLTYTENKVDTLEELQLLKLKYKALDKQLATALFG